jgi:Raf kinase inhibitor-like YbhB/YbcL family protein
MKYVYPHRNSRLAVIFFATALIILWGSAAMAMTPNSPAFQPNDHIPSKYTCEGEDVSPPLTWEGVPNGAKSLVLIIDDPDAPDPKGPKMVWVHWVVYNIPADTKSLPREQQILMRMLDGVDPDVIDEIRHAAAHVHDVKEVTEVRARWLGHRLHAEVNVTLPSQTTISAAHAIAEEVRHQLLHHLKYLSLVVIHVDPEEKSGERYHRIEEHTHDGLPAHSHAA